MKVETYLQENDVSFEVIPHEQAFSAQEVAAAEHVTGHKFAKTVILKGGGDAYMFVMPASRHVSMKKACEAVGTDVELATEAEMKQMFPDCEIGAEPPFGTLYDLPTYVDEHLAEREEIVFRAGTHDRTVKISYDDYASLEEPVVGDYAVEEF